MAYSEEEKENIIERIFTSIEDGNSLRLACQINKLPTKTFYEWIDGDEEKSKQYARACELRAEALLDELIDIVDEKNADAYIDDNGNLQIDGNAIQRSRLRYDARKWLISKLNPKKYGDKLDIDHKTNGKDIVQPIFGNNPLDSE